MRKQSIDGNVSEAEKKKFNLTTSRDWSKFFWDLFEKDISYIANLECHCGNKSRHDFRAPPTYLRIGGLDNVYECGEFRHSIKCPSCKEAYVIHTKPGLLFTH